MSIKALSTSDVTRYVSDLDPSKGTPEEATEATVFLLSPLTARQRAQVDDATTKWARAPESESDEQAASVNLNERMLLLAQAGLRGWERMKDDDGNDVEFKVASKLIGGVRVPCASEESMNRLRTDVAAELGLQVARLSAPKESDLKG